MKDRIILLSSYVLNLSVFLSNVSLFVKILLAVFAGATTIMAFFNQYQIFTKNFGDLWRIIIDWALSLILRLRRNAKK
jgi:hypothetical protein